mgnify:CR=1 FL=1
MQTLKQLLDQRILILDGAMGTMIQRYGLNEQDFRGSLFPDSAVELKGNNDLLCLTAPHLIDEIHRAYLEAGADIIETNSFNANAISMADYRLESQVKEINRAAARLARKAADDYSTPDKPRFVAGSIGPTNKSCSMSPDMENPALRNLDFDTLATAYREQITALIEGGVDLLLIETIFDTLNAKAALFAAQESMKATGREIPVMLSVTVTESGRTLSGQTLEAFLTAVSHAEILSVGLNCSFGAREMKPYLRRLASLSPYYISAYPNAGLPNRLGEYDETPASMAAQIKEFIDEGLVNIVGGCCGTTPEHIARYREITQNASPRRERQPAAHLWARRSRCLPRKQFRQHRRTLQCGRLSQIPEAHSRKELHRSSRHRPQTGRGRRTNHRHQHGRCYARCPQRDGRLLESHRLRARYLSGSCNDRLFRMGGYLRRLEMSARESHRQLHQPERRRRNIPRACP